MNAANKQHHIDNKYLNGTKYDSADEDKTEKTDSIKSDNNSKKFAFLAQQTVPDYRSQTVRFSSFH